MYKQGSTLKNTRYNRNSIPSTQIQNNGEQRRCPSSWDGWWTTWPSILPLFPLISLILTASCCTRYASGVYNASSTWRLSICSGCTSKHSNLVSWKLLKISIRSCIQSIIHTSIHSTNIWSTFYTASVTALNSSHKASIATNEVGGNSAGKILPISSSSSTQRKWTIFIFNMKKTIKTMICDKQM